MDTDYTGGNSDGSKKAPFNNLQKAIDQAATINAVGVIIGGSPTSKEQITLKNGVSIYGGFSRSRKFKAAFPFASNSTI